MRRFVSAILSLVIVLHAVLGCCWHHARCVESATRPHEHATSKCCHHHDATGDDGDDPQDSSDDCHEANCVFVRGEYSRVGDLATELALVATVDDVATLTSATRCGALRLGETRISHAPAGRLHLRLGVLLI
ncbi:MAG: hypothetical protein SGJ19_24600 [Planctomycetia bacterium]|nr:hypothetical protein [Planctomycetia bacterium]